MTANEVFEQLNLKTNQSGRFTEMLEMGVIQEVGERVCSITGRNVILWDVTDQLPKKKERKRKTK